MKFFVSGPPHELSPVTTRRLMFNVVLALVPAAAMGVYNFGLPALLMILVTSASAVLSELAWQVFARKPIRVDDFSALVTGLLLGLTLPPTVPLWMAGVGSAFAILVVKQFFGGLGYNFMNPALSARAMMLVSWPAAMSGYVAPGTDAVSSATPLAQSFTWLDMFLGKIPGSIGEVSKLMILAGLIWLLATSTISIRIPLSMIAGACLTSWALGINPLQAAMSGGLLFAAVFMATDYVTCPRPGPGQWLYGLGCGALTILMRHFGSYPEGVTFAILTMNVLTPLIDRAIRPRIYGHGRRERHA
jgi:Na+-translocating ferredoxin:NAD+ oxidoreductase subunit D